MSILALQTAAPTGLASVNPEIIYVLTDDTYAVVTATGYLTAQKAQGFTFNDKQMALVYTSDEGPVWCKVVISYSGASILNTVVSLVQISSPGDVTLPTIANNIIVSTDTVGSLANTTSTAINRGSIQAGLSGDAGALVSYPATAANGFLSLTAGNNSGGNFATFITNAGSVGQQQVISIPDSGQATSEFLLADGSTQHITSGDLQVDAGFVASGLAAGGFVGLVEAFPTTASSGFIAIQAAVNGTGDFGTTISNSTAQGQAQVVSVPDSGAATANFILSASAASTQSISSGLSITGTNNVQTSAGGQFIAGADANKGFFRSYPTTTANGYLDIEAIDNSSGDFSTTINNAAAVGQSQVISIPDAGAATANFVLAPSALVSGNVVTANGTAGLVQDGGFAVLANTTAAYGGGGTSNAFTATGLLATSIVTASILSSTSAVSIVKVVPSADTLTVDFSADPGASTTISWIAITPAV